ncbi:MAG TPA: dihydrofolate reductase family protein [Streptosporangiaceae bacterium]|nr:dihydrofolate reductase family protein [Streptosporangiaceae bacterium]
MQLIYQAGQAPRGGAASDRPGADQLARLYRYPAIPAGGAWVRANMIASLDGAAELAGRSGGLGGPADRELFQVLRALADVVLVGAGTARTEGYGPARPARTLPAGLVAGLRAGRPAAPAIAVVSGSLNLDPDAPLITGAAPDSATIVLTTETAPAARRAALAGRAEVITAGADRVSAGAAVAALASRGYQRILTEGGPRLLAGIAAEGLLDELCLTVSPVLAGGGARRILAGPGRDGADGAAFPAGFSLAHVIAADGFLLCRYVRQPA